MKPVPMNSPTALVGKDATAYCLTIVPSTKLLLIGFLFFCGVAPFSFYHNLKTSIISPKEMAVLPFVVVVEYPGNLPYLIHSPVTVPVVKVHGEIL